MRNTLLLAACSLALASTAAAGPLRNTPGLLNFTVHEGTGAVTGYVFANGTAFLSPSGAAEITTTANEIYDIFFSNSDGTFNIDGEFITINCFYSGAGSGCNINQVDLNTTFGSTFANTLTRFRSGGDGGYVPGSELNAVDGNLATSTSLGRDSESNMYLTVGFASTGNEVPEPATYGLIGAALAGGAFLRNRKKASK
jgi:hypothetical protein